MFWESVYEAIPNSTRESPLCMQKYKQGHFNDLNGQNLDLLLFSINWKDILILFQQLTPKQTAEHIVTQVLYSHVPFIVLALKTSFNWKIET